MSEENKENKNFRDELKQMKEEMRQMKEMLKQKAKESSDEEVNIGKKKGRIHFEFDDDDINFEGVDETLGSYLNSVMQGVAQNLSSSMKQMATGFQFNIKDVSHDIERNMRNVEKDVERTARQAERELRKANKILRKKSNRITFNPLSAEELVQFYEKAPDLTSALSDEKKLRLLKGLENSPQYQKDLSESTEIKGGTFKHHMDALLEVKYVAQEAVRGRYMITQLGIEALKLSEMLFRRFIFTTEESAEERSVEVDVEVDENLDTEIKTDIASDDEAVNNLSQNEEEEG